MFLARNDRLLHAYKKEVSSIREKITTFKDLSDQDIKNKFQDLKAECSSFGFKKVKETAIALVVLALERTIGLTPFDVQLIGSLALLDGKIAQMKTGEGKTLTASIAALARSIECLGSHVITVNEYLVRRDSAQTKKIAEFLGQTVSFVYSGQNFADKKNSYFSDITYATNSELGFDFLRNNMTLISEENIMRTLHFAIVDEVDSILIDEARTPLIISEQSNSDSTLFQKINIIAKKMTRSVSEDVNGFVDSTKEKLQELKTSGVMGVFQANLTESGDFVVDEKKKDIHITEEGFAKYELLLLEEKILGSDDNLYAVHNLPLMYHLEAALKAHHLFRENIDYIIRDGKIQIVDEFTGRVLEGRRWSYGIHQAIEAKEGVEIEDESHTAASITLQNLFREYKVLSGMTGTAKTEAAEFFNIYGLEVVEIGTNKPMIRKDDHDLVFLTHEGKIGAILEDILEKADIGRPVLVGTTTIEMSEFLSSALQKKNIHHSVLNAKQHEKEAHVIAQAGKKGSITIATNMAGRGTDILLGGNLEEERAANPSVSEEEIKNAWQKNHDEVVALGGLHVIGTERHESRRIDDQLRGRSGRQGDPGSSRFYISFDDDLMRLFAGRWAQDTLRVLGMKQDQAINSSLVTKQIEKAQRTIENQNFDIRKQLLDYDNVSNEQRRHIYDWRVWIKKPENQQEYIAKMVYDWSGRKVRDLFSKRPFILWEMSEVVNALSEISPKSLNGFDSDYENEDDVVQELFEKTLAYLSEKDPAFQNVVQTVLHEIDQGWREHLSELDLLRKGIHLRGFAQKDPKQEYKKEAYLIFEAMVSRAEETAIGNMLNDLWITSKPRRQSTPAPAAIRPRLPLAELLKRARAIMKNPINVTMVSSAEKRNELCSCGSGKRFKVCHGAFNDQVLKGGWMLSSPSYTLHLENFPNNSSGALRAAFTWLPIETLKVETETPNQNDPKKEKDIAQSQKKSRWRRSPQSL